MAADAVVEVVGQGDKEDRQLLKQRDALKEHVVWHALPIRPNGEGVAALNRQDDGDVPGVWVPKNALKLRG